MSKQHLCCDCSEPVKPEDVPVWRELRILGVTWIFGRWIVHYPDQCLECRMAREDNRLEQIYEAGQEDGARRAFEAGEHL